MGWGQYEYLSSQILQAQAATVRITASTAVMISDRYAITAAHSPLDENNQVTPNLTVENIWGEVRKIVNVSYVVNEDFAIVELESPFNNSYSVKLAARTTEPDDQVFIVGNPWTVANAGIGWAVAFGADAALQRRESWLDVFDIDVQGGFSGSGIYNEAGELVGILSGTFTDRTLDSPYFNADLPFQNTYWDVRNGWLAAAINLDFIKTFMASHGVANVPRLAQDLPPNHPDPVNLPFLSSDDLAVAEALSMLDKHSNVLLSNSGAEDWTSALFASGGSGTLIHENLILTALHALDARRDLSVGYYDQEVDPAAKTYAISQFGDFGLVAQGSLPRAAIPMQEIAVHDTASGAGAYHIGSPRDFWYSEGGWWAVGARALGNGQYLSVSGGGMSGGGLYNLDSDLVGVTSTAWGGPAGVQGLLNDRQDSHATSYNPTVFTGEAYTATSDFFYLKRFVSEYSPASIDRATNDYFASDAIVAEGAIYEVGWHTSNSHNVGYVKKYTTDSKVDATFGIGGVASLDFGNGDETVKSILSYGSKLYVVGSTVAEGLHTAFVARLDLNGRLDSSYGTGGVVLLQTEADDRVNAATIAGDGAVYVAGTRFNGTSNDTFIAKVANGALDASFGTAGYWVGVRDSSSDFAADIVTRADGEIYLLSTTDKNGDWDYELSAITRNGKTDTTFGAGGNVTGDYKDAHDIASTLLLTPDGLVAAGYTQYSADEAPLLMKYTFDGKAAPSFGDGGVLYVAMDQGGNNYVTDCELGANGSIEVLVAGLGVVEASEGWGDRLTLPYTTKLISISAAGVVDNESSVTYVSTSANYGSNLLTSVGETFVLWDKAGADGYFTVLNALSTLESQGSITKGVHLDGIVVEGSRDGNAVSVVGSSRDDLLEGSGGRDTIQGNNGDDMLLGGGGNDLMDGGPGDDRLYGGDGDDTLQGGGGFDHLNGGEGSDQLIASPGGGEIFGYGGIDTVVMPGAFAEYFVWQSGDAGNFLAKKDDPSLIYLMSQVESFAFADRTLTYDQLIQAGEFYQSPVVSIRLAEFLDSFIVPRSASSSQVFDIAGGISDNFIWTAAGDDTLNGGWGNDRLYANDGDDSLSGGPGNDTIDGGSGNDIAVYASLRSDSTLCVSSAGSVSVSGPEGMDSLTSIERVVFSDAAVRFDVSGIGGKAYRLYVAAFDRAPDSAGLGYWIDYLEHGANLKLMANAFLNVSEFTAIYGNNPTNEEFVRLVYEHTLHRTPDAAGLQWWLDAMVNKNGAYGHAYTRGEVLLGFSESAENKAAVIGVIQNGIDYTPWSGA